LLFYYRFFLVISCTIVHLESVSVLSIHSLCNFCGATTKIKGSLLRSIPLLSVFRGRFWLGCVTCNRVLLTTPNLESSTPICLFTIQLSWRYGEESGSLLKSIPLLRTFGRKIWLAFSRDLTIGGRRQPQICNPLPIFAYSL